MLRNIVTWSLLSMTMIFVQSSHATNGMVPHGFGTKQKGLAGAGVALPMDSMSVATNPASGVWVGNGHTFGVGLFSPWREATEYNPATGLAGGFVIPGSYESDSNFFLVPFGAKNWMLDSQSAFTLAIYGAGGMNSDYSGDVWNGPSVGGTGIDLKQLFVTPTYSQKLGSNSSFGIGVVLAMQAFKAKGLGEFTPFSVDGTSMTDNGTDIAFGYGAKFGFHTELQSGLSVGISYATKVNMQEFDDYRGLFADAGKLDYPPILTAGLAWKPNKTSVVVFDIQQIYYSEVDSIGRPINSILNCPALGGADPASCFGGSNGPGFGWDDMTVYKLGYQWQSGKDWTFRVGYSHGKNPVKQTTLSILAPGVIENHLTFGFTKKTGKNSELNFAAMYAPESEIRRVSAIGFPEDVELKMNQFELELSWSKRF